MAKRRLGLDMGTNSIGWCLTDYDDDHTSGTRIVDIGVRIFSNGREPPKNGGEGLPLAAARRLARGMRRRRDRYIGRRSAFMDALVEHKLMPADADEAKLLADLDPYKLRAEALERRLEPYEIGRALFHLNQRRGFKSNRKAERKSSDNKDGVVEAGRKSLDAAMKAAKAETLGAFLAKRLEDGSAARVRMNGESQVYDFYPQRSHYEYEFRRIWEEQAKHHRGMMTSSARTWDELKEWAGRDQSTTPDEARDALYRALFFQRPLKEQEVGLCSYAGLGSVGADEKRLPKWHPLFQQRRLYEEVNHLKVVSPGQVDRDLTRDERDRLIRVLKVTKEPTFATLTKELCLQSGERFNKDSETRKTLLGDVVYATMAHKKLFGNAWPNMPLDSQLAVIDRLLNEESPEKLHEYLRVEHSLTEGQIAQAEIASRSLPEGYGRLGLTATRAVITELERYLDEDGRVITADKAVKRGLTQHHSDRRDGVDYSKGLPYYGEILSNQIAPAPLAHDEQEKRFGKITNPTVHIGLRQLEKLVNAVIKVHGRPDEIVVELARELKLNDKDKEEHNTRIRRDTAAAIARGEKLAQEGFADNGANRMLMRMWEELNPANTLDRRCPYCGEPIGIRLLFDAQGGADIDHIIPYSRSLDDSAGNKVVAHRGCNRAKANKTPWEKWGGTDRWDTITAQVARLHKSKQWRFGPDAMARVEKDGGFIARQLTDTQYLSRMARTYLSSLYADKDEGSVYVVPGRMTAMLRRLWGLNSLLPDHNFVDNKHSDAPKNRLDHRHHAIDAAVTAVTTRGLLNEIARTAGQAEDRDLDRLFEGLDQPWPNFREDLRDKLAAVIVSHKPDHGRKGMPKPGHDTTAGRLHNDTAYGFTGEVAPDGKTPIVVHRVPLMSLKPGDLSNPDRIPDPLLRDALHRATDGLTGKEYERALARFRDEHPDYKGIRRVRVREPLNVIPVRDKSGRAYKAYKGDSNARFDVWRLPDGKWVSDIVSMFDAHQPDQTGRRPHPAAKKVLSLRQNDMLAVERDGGPRELVRVVKFSRIGTMQLATANEAGPLKARDASPQDTDPFRYINTSTGGLRNVKARQVRIDPLGRVFDPGPR